MIHELPNHLWQSTLFAAAAGLLTLAFRKNRAQVRYWLWFSASVKFLLPFSLLISLGSHWGSGRQPARPAAPLAVSYTIVQISEPFPRSVPLAPSTPSAADWPRYVIFGVWGCGFAGVALMRLRGWLSIRAILWGSRSCRLPLATVPVRTSPGLLEPGVVGSLRPILLLPDGIMERLTPSQLGAVLAHELCHIRRRDNSTAAIHMLVEAVFWFHPLVWWIGARLVEERERACDEAVLRLGSDPRDYAEAILNVCKLYAESPLACVSGVTGSNLKRRIHAIMTQSTAHPLNFAKKTALAVVGVATLAAPIIVGVVNAPAIRAQSTNAAKPKFEVASIRPCGEGGGEIAGSKQKGRGGGASSPGSLTLRCLALVEPDGLGLIHRAYDRFANGRPDPWAMLPISGGPAWIRSERYDINAKADGNASDGTMNGPMLQALLEDRFKLKIHHQTRQVPVYSLTVAKNGPKLKPWQEGSCTPIDWARTPRPIAPGLNPCDAKVGGRRGPNVTLEAQRTSLDETAKLLGLVLDRPVVDKTGIKGLFDFHLAFAVDQTTPRYLPGGDLVDMPSLSDDPPAPSVFTAVQEQLGLKLAPAKGPREYIVIDHVERPSEN